MRRATGRSAGVKALAPPGGAEVAILPPSHIYGPARHDERSASDALRPYNAVTSKIRLGYLGPLQVDEMSTARYGALAAPTEQKAQPAKAGAAKPRVLASFATPKVTPRKTQDRRAAYQATGGLLSCVSAIACSHCRRSPATKGDPHACRNRKASCRSSHTAIHDWGDSRGGPRGVARSYHSDALARKGDRRRSVSGRTA